MKLILLEAGGAQLTNDNELDVLWASDNDQAFRDEFGDELLTEDDVTEIFEYLVEKNILDDEDVENVEIFAEGIADDEDEEDDVDDFDEEDE